MHNTKKKRLLLPYCIAFLVLLLGISAILTNNVIMNASAATSDPLVYSLFTNPENGQVEYRVNLSAAEKPNAVEVIIPTHYLGKPVTEIADGGFMSSPKLERVKIPYTVRKIGQNAFANCKLLEKAAMPKVKIVGSNAFAMCTSLSPLSIPDTATTVGATVFRNTVEPVYVQADAVGSGWDPNWKQYNTGELILGSDAPIYYQEIKDPLNTNVVVGYEVADNAWQSFGELVIYSSIPQANGTYLPVRNINSEAFLCTTVESLTIKHRPEYTSPYAINMRSFALAGLDVTGNAGMDGFIDIQTNMTHVDPTKDDNVSTNIFQDCTAARITLPSTMESIPTGMFFNCTALKEIRIAGISYTGKNVLPNVLHIGTYAFQACYELTDLVVPGTVTSTGNNLFKEWAGTQKITIKQIQYNISKYWDPYWNGGNANITIDTLTITLDKQGGTGGSNSFTLNSELPASVSIPSKTGNIFDGYYSGKNGAGKFFYDGNGARKTVWDEQTSTLYAKWREITYIVVLDYYAPGENDFSFSWNAHGPVNQAFSYSSTVGAEAPIDAGDYVFDYWEVSGPGGTWTTTGVESGSVNKFSSSQLTTVNGAYVNLTACYQKKPCVAEGTLITLADGSQVAVENLNGDELLLVWNLLTGQFDEAPILFIDTDSAKNYEIIHLFFSDGTNVKTIYEHAFFDFNLNEYVFLRKDAAQYIGHWFNKQITDSNGNQDWTKVQLIDVQIYTEFTTSWSPVTFGHLCYYVNGMLSMPGATEGLINIFEVDGNTMTINQEAFLCDIEEYGLFTYEEFAEIFPIPEVMFEAFNGQYLKISIGKGLIDIETLGALIARYAAFLDIA